MEAVQRGPRTVPQAGPVVVLTAGALLLAGLDATTGLDGRAWVVGLASAVATAVALGRGVARHRRRLLGPADRVTLVRAVLACGLAGLAADSTGGAGHAPGPGAALVVLASVALSLDWVDGQVARRTGTASGFGAAFDMEVDAFVVLVLSAYVARAAGPWVLAIGAARYLLLVAGRLQPWLRAPMPPRYWAKVVAATQGVVLVVVAADVLPPGAATAALLVALTVLACSFGHQAWWLWRHRAGVVPAPAPAPSRVRT